MTTMIHFDTSWFKSFPNNKILAWSKLKAFADDKMNAIHKQILVFGWEENIYGKRKKCCLPAFSPFPTIFSKGFFFRAVNSRGCVVKS